jgi:hypothetical protein
LAGSAQQADQAMQARREEAEMIFRRVGITFAVYGDKDEDGSGTERLIPFDLIPRLIDAQEWKSMEAGLVQRVTALNRLVGAVRQARGLARYYPEGSAVDILYAAAFPGVRTGEIVSAGKLVAFSETATVQHDHSDGKSYAITFYRLADGRGWVHDFNDDKLGQPACLVIVSSFTRFKTREGLPD